MSWDLRLDGTKKKSDFPVQRVASSTAARRRRRQAFARPLVGPHHTRLYECPWLVDLSLLNLAHSPMTQNKRVRDEVGVEDDLGRGEENTKTPPMIHMDAHHSRAREIDVLCVGDILLELIAHEQCRGWSIDQVLSEGAWTAWPGGGGANVALLSPSSGAARPLPAASGPTPPATSSPPSSGRTPSTRAC